MSVNTEIARKEESRELKRNARVHSDTATGPRAVLGSQQPRTDEGEQIGSTPPVQSNALRAQDGSRSASAGHFRNAPASATVSPFQSGHPGSSHIAAPGRARSVGADYLGPATVLEVDEVERLVLVRWPREGGECEAGRGLRWPRRRR